MRTTDVFRERALHVVFELTQEESTTGCEKFPVMFGQTYNVIVSKPTVIIAFMVICTNFIFTP